MLCTLIWHREMCRFQLDLIPFPVTSLKSAPPVLNVNSLYVAVNRMQLSPSIFLKILQKIFKNFRIVKYCGHIWNQDRKCITMSINNPVFGPVVLEIACDISIQDDIPIVVSVKTEEHQGNVFHVECVF